MVIIIRNGVGRTGPVERYGSCCEYVRITYEYVHITYVVSVCLFVLWFLWLAVREKVTFFGEGVAVCVSVVPRVIMLVVCAISSLYAVCCRFN